MTGPLANALATQSAQTVLEPGTTAKKNAGVSQGEFLTLFITQLQNQDPLSPLEAEQMTAQLAQFASLEQLTGINTRLDQLSVLSQQGLLSMIGREVAFGGGSIAVADAEASSVAYELEENAARVSATVRNEAGDVVRVVEIGSQEVGRHTFDFDGRDAAGKVVPDGQYRVEITAAANGDSAPTSLDLSIRDTVDGIDFSVDPPVLLVGGLRVPLDQVHEVRVDSQPTETPETVSNQ
jgi:flagellar basal-body rod modification protein FlgD